MTDPDRKELLKACDEIIEAHGKLIDETYPTAAELEEYNLSLTDLNIGMNPRIAKVVATKLKSLLTEHDGWVWVPKEALHVARYVMEVYSMQTTYMGERIGGVLDGCPRGKTPTPDQLSRNMQIVLDRFNELLAAAPKKENLDD